MLDVLGSRLPARRAGPRPWRHPAMSVQAMKTGALEFLTKPFRDRELLDAIHQAIQRDCANRKDQAEIAEQSSGRRCEQRWDYRHSMKSNRVQKTDGLQPF